MEKMREEFEAWVKGTFNIDCSEMFFGIKDHDEKEQYYDDDDADGAIAVSAMFYAWRASRAVLCVELPKVYSIQVLSDPIMDADEVRWSLEEAGVYYK